MARGAIVVFVGPIGVGKTTLIRSVSSIINSKSAYVLLKSFNLLSYYLWKIMSKIIRINRNEREAIWLVIPKKYPKIARVITLISVYIDSFIALPIKIIYIKLMRYLGYLVLVEEHVCVACFDYIYSYVSLNIPFEKFISRLPLIIMSYLNNSFNPDIVFYLKADKESIERRWKERGYGDPQERYVKLHSLFLDKIFKNNEIIIIDTSGKSIKEELLLIKDALSSTKGVSL